MNSELDDLDLTQLRARHGAKWSRYGAAVIPAWVAEMDFRVAPAIRDAITAAVVRGDLGYPPRSEHSGLPALFADRMATRYGWQPDPDLTLVLPDVMRGVYLAIDAFTSPGEAVAVQTPVYPPFLTAVDASGRARVDGPLVERPNRYTVDMDALHDAFRAGARLLLLCNPQNPTGRVFDRTELTGIADLARAHDVVVVADEIHADLVYPGNRHIPFASLSEDVAARTLTLYSASKAFNIAGLRCAVLHAGSGALHERILALPEHTRHGAGILGLHATRAAWTEGDAWLDEVLGYMDANRHYLTRFVREEMPGVGYHEPDATFLAWFDMRAFDLTGGPTTFLREQAGVALGDGAEFGSSGAGHVRLTFATSRRILGEILKRIAITLSETAHA